MKVSDIVKKTIKVSGTIAKVGVELGADLVGAIAEKIDDKPEEKDKIVTSGKELGQKIKKATNEIAEDSVDVVDDLVESGKEAFEDISEVIRKKTRKYTKKDEYDSWTSEFDDEYDSYDDVTSTEFTSSKGTYKSTEKEVKNGRTYITINTNKEANTDSIQGD
ncbi:MAG: hypothetical protein GX995_01970 [Clostridiales bacterium]|jgi:Arc/MetJ-type ribon-helix-helix transcriptional regulator|nr:hypothetical protein [Clostridiales bacterium]